MAALGDHVAEPPPASVPLSFTPEDWLLLFPEAPVSDSPLTPPPVDPAAELRTLRPPTRAWLLAALPTPLLRGLTRLQLALSPFTQTMSVSTVAATVLSLVFATAWAFRTPLLGTRQLVAGTVVLAVAGLANVVTAPATDVSLARSVDPRHHPMGQLALWSETVRDKRASQLLGHEDADGELCPCPAPACGGSIPGAVGTGKMVELALQLAACLMVTAFFIGWTPLFGILAAQTWSTPWSTALAALTVAANVAHCSRLTVANVCARPGFMAQELSLRLHHRAVFLALRDLVARYTSRLAVPGDAAGTCDDLRKKEPFVALHASLVPEWQNRLASLDMFVSIPSMLVLTFFVSGIIYVSTGGCIPLWPVAYPIYALGELLLVLLNFTASNSQVLRISRLFSAAERQLADLAASAPAGHPALPVLEARLRQLRLCADGAPYTARLAGVDVTGGVVRALVVTVFSVAVGLFTLLKGAGVAFTIETFCPTYG
ncbi:hypothetical protein DFJ74DRAFT_702904 [Hyaloraphidium curvatum]|nr:hypothetical protein DFJ74DRAFT_702904 [Hyaloraphidium curvatum]